MRWQFFEVASSLELYLNSVVGDSKTAVLELIDCSASRKNLL